MRVIIRNEEDEEVGNIDIDMDEFGHELCMGIRHGLYGVDAGANESINDGLNNIADALNRIADALSNKQTN